jgi:hypothetical protein
MTDLLDLRRKAEEARDALYAAEAEERDRRNAALVGKCFRGRTSYSCPEGPDDYWPVFAKVIGVEGGQLILFEFSCDKNGKYVIDPREKRTSIWSGYGEISESAFRDAWLRMVEEMNAAATAAIQEG